MSQRWTNPILDASSVLRQPWGRTTSERARGWRVRLDLRDLREGIAAVRRALSHTLDRLRITACGIRGHQMQLVCEPDRLSLRCLECAYNTPGWQVGVRQRDWDPRLAVATRGRRTQVGRDASTGPIAQEAVPSSKRNPTQGSVTT
jgi:hypothetical protein